MTKRDLTVDEKTEIVLKMFAGKKSATEISKQYQVNEEDVYYWCALFLKGARKAFEKKGDEEVLLTHEDIEYIKILIRRK